MTKKPTQKPKYDADFKATLVNRYLAGGHTLKALSKEANIRPDTLSDWVRAYQKANAPAAPSVPTKVKAAPSHKSGTPVPTVSKTPQTPSLAEKTEIEQLRKALKEAVEEREVLQRALRIISSH